MRRILIATIATVALTFGASFAMADHARPSRPTFCPSGSRGYARTYQTYRYSPSYYNRYHAPGYSPYRSRYYGYSPYSRGGIGVQGSNFSFHVGF